MNAKGFGERRRLLALMAGAGLVGGAARGQGFPSKPIQLLVGFPAGSSLDVQMRLLGAAAARELGQPLVIVNQPGVSGTLVSANVARAAPDGHTLAAVSSTMFRLPHLQKVAYDALNDFSYLIALSTSTYGVVVLPERPWKNLPELLAHAKANPDKVSFGGVGIASPGHISIERMARQAGFKATTVPYKGGPELWQAVTGGHLDVVVEGGWGALVDQGKLKALAVLSEQRSKRWPNVPTAREQGFDVVMAPVTGLVGPKGMDPAVVQRLHDAFRRATTDADYLKALDQQGQALAYMGSDDYRKFAHESFANEKRVLDELGFKRTD